MRVYTSHLRQAQVPQLVPEGFSCWALIFGWLYFLAKGAWLPAALNFALWCVTWVFAKRLGSAAPLLALHLAQGVFARDIVRWNLLRIGFSEGPVVAAADHDSALARLFAERPDILAQTARDAI